MTIDKLLTSSGVLHYKIAEGYGKNNSGCKWGIGLRPIGVYTGIEYS